MKIRMTMIKHVFVLFFLPVLISCGNSITFDNELFYQKWALWLEQDIQDYSFRQYWHSGSGETHRTIIVKDGIFTYYRMGGRGRPDDETLYPPPVGHGQWITSSFYMDSITNLFAEIERLYTSIGTQKNITAIIRMEYDSEFHFPTHFYYERPNYYIGFPGIDYSFAIEISNFTIGLEILE